MDKPQLTTHSDYCDILARHRNHDALDALISRWTHDKPAADVMRMLQGAGVSAAPVMTGEAIFNDPQYQERSLLSLLIILPAGRTSCRALRGKCRRRRRECAGTRRA